MKKRTIRFEVRFTKDEITAVQNKAKKCGLSTSGYVRHVLAGFSPVEKPDKEFYDTMRELSAIGNRINQLAAKANALNFIDAPLIAAEAKKWAQFQSAVQEKYLVPKRRSDGGV